MKKITRISGLLLFVPLFFSNCGTGKTESDKSTIDSTKTEVKLEKSDSVIINKESVTPNNCNVKISDSYTDYWSDLESGDMGGTLFLTFIKCSKC